MKATEVNIENIVVDMSIYPRQKWSTSTIDRYADAMSTGESFPPITLEAETEVLLDGMHRLKAAQKIERKTILAEHAVVPDGIPTKLYAASLSARHGDRITRADLKALAREIYTENPDFKASTVAKLLGIPERTVRDWVSDLINKRREERQAKAMRLAWLGWTNQQIADELGVAEPSIREDRKNGESAVSAILDLHGKGETVGEIARRNNLPDILVQTAILRDKDDAERMDQLGINVQPFDVWNFRSCHDLMGYEYAGRIPGELVAHVLYFYTKPGDLILDPMVGSGTTLDACLLMGRKCLGYDINDETVKDRCDVIKHDLRLDGWPSAVAKAKMILWDAPYFDKKDSEYTEGSISRLPIKEYLKFFTEKFAALHKAVKPGTLLAFVMSDWDDGKGDGIFVWDYADLMRDAGWKLTRHIQAPLPTQQVHPDIVIKFRASRRLARLERYILIASV